ncbi:MAG TPA: hypothetical protein VFA40_08065, partial [Terriglobales bacterium]|nr:hypothetical protein [Terriglobales bacterium]
YPERSLRRAALRPRLPGAIGGHGRVSQGHGRRDPRETVLFLHVLEAATQSAAEKSIKHAYWALAQYDFVYKPRPGRKVDERAPFFLGVFDWNDAEDDEVLAAWARGEE